MISELRYFHVTCDKGDCPAYVNVTAQGLTQLPEVLQANKWASVNGTARCPAHPYYGLGANREKS